MPEPLAIYAAIVGTAGLGWQVWREVRRLRTDIRVEFEHAAKHRQFYVAWAGDPDTRPEPLQYELTVVVVNDGETTEWVREITIENRARTQGYEFDNTEGDEQLEPRSRVFARERVEHMDFDPSDGFVGTARLASGRKIESKLERLNQDILDHIAEHNRTAKP
jgi:hypothetical protein